MDHLEAPDRQQWEARRIWFEAQFDIENGGGGAYVWGEQASALLIELQAVFCAGAYISVIILGCAIIDAHLREVEADDRFEGGMQAAFSKLTSVSELDWLRKRRNSLVHFRRQTGAALTVDDQWLRRSSHETDARRAIELVSKVLFENPWI